MSRCLFILYFAAFIGISYGSEMDDFRVKHGWSGSLENIENFFKIPRNAMEAETAGFVDMPYEKDHNLDLTMKCFRNDVRVCPLFDKAGTIAGLQIAIPQKNLADVEHYVANKMRLKYMLGEPYYTSSHYVVSPDSIKNGGRRGPIQDTVEELWVENGNEIVKIPLNEEDLAEKTIYIKQNCIPAMGTHYHYNMSEQMDCHQFRLYSILVKHGKVIGIVFQIFGHTETHDRPWFESTSSARGIEMVLPSAPECIAEWLEKYKAVSLHIYYAREPWKIICESGDSVEPLSVANKVILNSARYAGKLVEGVKKIYKNLT